MLCCQFYCCWCCPSQYGWGNCCPFFRRGCWRCAAHFTAVDAVLRTAARVDAAPLSAVGIGVILPILLLLAYVPPLTLRRNEKSLRMYLVVKKILPRLKSNKCVFVAAPVIVVCAAVADLRVLSCCCCPSQRHCRGTLGLLPGKFSGSRSLPVGPPSAMFRKQMN